MRMIYFLEKTKEVILTLRPGWQDKVVPAVTIRKLKQKEAGTKDVSRLSILMDSQRKTGICH